MCTASWIHNPDGYYLFFNRDERKTRAAALSPTRQSRKQVSFIAPTDPEFGGTWIAVNEFGLSVSLLNGANLGSYSNQSSHGGWCSRGLLIHDLISFQSTEKCVSRLGELDLDIFAPFTTIFLEPGKPAVLAEWNGKRTTVIPAGDSWMPLTSSSYDPEGVRLARTRELARLSGVSEAMKPETFRDFHSSHGERASPYSCCMHRDEAETVSFSCVEVTSREARFAYSPGSPCAKHQAEIHVLQRKTA